MSSIHDHVCALCGHGIQMKRWLGGPCPKCGTEYSWGERYAVSDDAARRLYEENAFLRQLISDLKSENDGYRRGVEVGTGAEQQRLLPLLRRLWGEICFHDSEYDHITDQEVKQWFGNELAALMEKHEAHT